MFERFTDRARVVVVVAQEESRRLGHNYIGTEHILLGLLIDGDGVAARALRSFEVDLDEARAAVAELVGSGGSEPSGHIPFTPRAKKVLELSLREAMQLGHNYIGTEHILLGLLREGEGIGARVLIERGVTLDAAREKVTELLQGLTSGEVDEHAESQGERAREEREPSRAGPTCPRCPAPFPDRLRSRRARVAGVGGRLTLLYCDTCGATVAILP